LNAEIDDNSNNEISKLKKVLLGFTNTIQDKNNLPIKARFRDHNYQGECIDYLDEENFFTPEDFNSADHHFIGNFDEYGQFHGSISIFGSLMKEVTIPWMKGGNVPTSCGSFDIHLASVQGRKNDTKLTPEAHTILIKKTNQIGGLYIYRDGIRVLPYGGPEFDFIGVEYRRTKSFSGYYFSYRNMIGYIDITKKNNFNLQEKAGREGFIENKAYKQFKSILENFFIYVARTYFVDEGEMSDLFREQRNRNQEIYEALEKRQRLKTEKRKRLQENLRKFFEKFNSGIWDTRITKLKEEILLNIQNFNSDNIEYDNFIFNLEEKFKKQINQIREELKINIPTGIGFGKELTQQIDYQKLCLREVEQNIEYLQDWFNEQLVFLEDLYGDRINLRRRLTDSFTVQEELHKKKINEIYKQAEESIQSLTKWATDEIKKNRNYSYETLIKVKEEFASTNLTTKNTHEIYEIKKSIEMRLETLTQEIIEKLDKLNSQINVTKEGTSENQVSSAQLTAALEAENEHLKEQHEENIEMIQLGMALGVVHHEFNNNIISVRRGISEFRPWAERNQKLYPIYEKIRLGFDHLDGYLRIFTPLSRRLSRKQVEITGKALSSFIREVFTERCEKENIILEITENFINYKTFGFTSTIFPAFVNIIDNAIYWVIKSTVEKKVILDADNNSFIISDTGPGVQTIDMQNIFEFGFSRRIGGRGMGLYVTKQTLEKDGFQISLDPYNPTSGATFRIFKNFEESI
ncbi:TPA: ATP-binding protein, partial [Acinetobacter baumannii]